MNKILTLVAALALGCSAFSAHAQLKFGAKVGANFSSMPTSISEINSSSITAFHAGPMLEFRLPVIPLAIDAAVLYSQTGGKYTEGGTSETLKSHALQIPVHAKLRYGILPAVKVLALAGPNLGIHLSDNLGDVVKNLHALSKADAQKINLGLNVGLGVELINMVQVTAQYTIPMSKDFVYTCDLGNNFDIKGRVFSLSAAVLF